MNTKLAPILLALLVMTAALAGCSDKKKAVVDDTPEEISRTDVERLEQLVTEKYPRLFAFPGQELADTLTVHFNGSVAQATALASAETPTDDAFTDFGGEVVPFDIASYVPIGQPVELRVKLKWYGDPGASADLDIYANVPGTHDAYSEGRFDESFNWAIITKFRVLNTIHQEGVPFEVGFQVNNGKTVVPEGMRYELTIEMHFPQDVLGPGIPYRITVPPEATTLFFQSEPVTGDEHIQSEVMLIGPDKLLKRHIRHNDISTETFYFAVPEPGDYVVYAPEMHGGFLRLEADVPNPQWNATALPVERTEVQLLSQVAVSPAAPGLEVSGSFDVGPSFPLDIQGYLRTTQAGFVPSANLTFSVAGKYLSSVAVDAHVASTAGRLGSPLHSASDRGALAIGPVEYTFKGNTVEDGVSGQTVPIPAGGAVGLDVGYILTSVAV